MLNLSRFHAAFEGGNELVDLERFLQIVESAELQRLDRAVGARIRRHDDDHAIGIVELELLEERDAIHRLHVDVGEHEIEFLGLVADERLSPSVVNAVANPVGWMTASSISWIESRSSTIRTAGMVRSSGSANTLEAAGARLTSRPARPAWSGCPQFYETIAFRRQAGDLIGLEGSPRDPRRRLQTAGHGAELKIGRNMAMTMPPTITPRNTMSSGSISEVRDATVASHSMS